jgi:hypothetical protein
MGWARGRDSEGREVGYAVEDVCHAAECEVAIDRGIAYACGGVDRVFDASAPGCGLHFCYSHLLLGQGVQLCAECFERASTPDNRSFHDESPVTHKDA